MDMGSEKGGSRAWLSCPVLTGLTSQGRNLACLTWFVRINFHLALGGDTPFSVYLHSTC